MAFFVGAAPASAHGGTVNVDEDLGPYHVVVASSAALATKELLLTVVLTGKREGNDDSPPVAGAQVTATLALTGSVSPALEVTIPPEPNLGSQGYYETRLTLPSEGDWLVKIDISGREGTASASFTVVMRLSSLLGNPTVWIAVALLAGATVCGFIYLRRRALAMGKEPRNPS